MWAFKSSIYHFGTCFQHLSRHLTGPRPHYDLHQPRSWRGLDVLMKNVICHALTTTYTHASTTLVHAPAATGAIPLRYLTACSIMRSVRPIWSRHALATLLPRAYHTQYDLANPRVSRARNYQALYSTANSVNQFIEHLSGRESSGSWRRAAGLPV